jgi:iron transport multicopper oxidase
MSYNLTLISFTPRGIVALAFSIVTGLLGVAVISWYGLAEMGTSDIAAENLRVANARLDEKEIK